LEVISYVSERWESLLLCVERSLKLWPYLKTCLEDSDSVLLESLKDPEYELYSYLLYVFLHKLVGYIIYFQKPNLLLDQVIEKMKEAFILFSRMLLKTKYQDSEFEDMLNIPFDEEENIIFKERLLDNKEFITLFGERYPRICELIETVKAQSPKNSRIEAQVYGHAKAMILQTVIALKKRLPYQNHVINQSLIVYLKQIYSIEKWRELIKLYPSLSHKDSEVPLLDELDRFTLRYKTIVQDHKDSGISITRRWNILKSDFPTLAKIAKALLLIPYSTSAVENLFSEFKALKTPYRNRLSVKNLESSILAEQYFRSDHPRILPEMITRYLNMWKNEEEGPVSSNVKSTPPKINNSERNENQAMEPTNSKETNEINTSSDAFYMIKSMINLFSHLSKSSSNKADLSPMTSKNKRKALEYWYPKNEKKKSFDNCGR